MKEEYDLVSLKYHPKLLKAFLFVSRLSRSANKRIFCLSRMFSHPEIELRQVEFFQACNIYNSLFTSSWTQSDKSTAANTSIFHIKENTHTQQRQNFRQTQNAPGFIHQKNPKPKPKHCTCGFVLIPLLRPLSDCRLSLQVPYLHY